MLIREFYRPSWRRRRRWLIVPPPAGFAGPFWGAIALVAVFWGALAWLAWEVVR